jgi:serine/threonine-protein kinase
MVLSWMPGGSLADLMRREPVAPARAVEIACSVLDALGEAHRLGILHRDVKPANVLFDEIGTARLSDFGAAHLGDLSTTATAGAIGTFSYMSPEQRLGRPATVASDLYAVGAMLVELLTGAPAEPTRAGRLDLPPSAVHPDLGAAHDAVVALLLEQDPTLRPADAFEARRMLSALSWSLRIPDRPLPAPRARTTDRPPSSDGSRLCAARDPGDGRDAAHRRHDSWIGRDVLVLDTAPQNLERARGFARAGHAALPTVLRVDVAAAEIWIAPALGRALADEARPVSPGQLARLEEALTALHTAGGAHGCLDHDHLYWHDGEITLAFPRAPARPDDAERDREALRRLADV